MRVGIMNDPWSGTLGDMRDEVAWAARVGAHTYWLAQVWRYDAFTLIPSLAATAPSLRFATSVAATFHRHPMTMASQALTANLLTGGRFTLGIGLMHKPVIEGMFGLSFDKPVRHMSEYLDILLPLLAQKPSDASGVAWTYRGPIDVPGAPECPVLLAALGTQMLGVCGRRTAGTITFMTGPHTIRDHVVPTLTAAANSAGRDAPRVVALVPVHVTDDVTAGRRPSRAGTGYLRHDAVVSRDARPRGPDRAGRLRAHRSGGRRSRGTRGVPGRRCNRSRHRGGGRRRRSRPYEGVRRKLRRWSALTPSRPVVATPPSDRLAGLGGLRSPSFR